MKTNCTKRKLAALAFRFSTLTALYAAQLSLTLAQGAAFTCQGRLSDDTNPANGSYDLRFALIDTPNADMPNRQNTPGKKAAAIRWDQVGAKAGADYHGDGLSVAATGVGARLHCVFQRLDGEVTGEGLWLVSMVTNQSGDRFRVLATQLGRLAPCAPPLANTTNGGQGTVCPTHTLPLSGNVDVTNQTAQFTRAGLVEEYSVSMDGVRQDLVVPEKPAGAGPLEVQLAVSGAWVEQTTYGAQLVLEKSGRKIAYGRLHATDAKGKELPGRIEANRNAERPLAVVVNDADAVYPVRIDPTFSDANWISLGSVDGTDGEVYDAVVDGSGNLYIGGFFTVVGNVIANDIAEWNGSSWSSLGSGMNNAVTALAVSGGTLYAGGGFTTAGGNAVSAVAEWNGSSWSPLGSGMNNYVDALAVSGGTLYAGGVFTASGDGSQALNYIAQWNGSSWSPLGSGMNKSVGALAVSGSTLYVGGAFTRATNSGNAAVTANYIAQWDGSSWSPLGSGMNSSVDAVAVSGTTLYAGGAFTTATNSGNVAVTANYIAQWNGSSWSALGSGVGGGPSPYVFTLTVSGTGLYAGGAFTLAGGKAASYIAQWNGTTWSALGTGMGVSSSAVYALAVSGTDLYAGGSFTKAGANAANNIAQWNGGSWSPLGSGMNGAVDAVAVSGGTMYAGGDFTTAGGRVANYIAQWNGSSWSPLGSGMDAPVYALAVWGTNLYVGGGFSTAGGKLASFVAQWNAAGWSPLGSGMDYNVYALAVSGSTLYAGGDFIRSGDGSQTLNYIAQWNGSGWSALGSGMNFEVQALAVAGSTLYAGGYFTASGDNSQMLKFIAQWDGSSWSPLGSGMNGNVLALAVSGSTLYVGGEFSTAGGGAANNIAQWNGIHWSRLESGVDGYNPSVNALAVLGTNLYAGGGFTTAGGGAANDIAQWNGSSWSALGSGMNFEVNALAVSDGTLYAGGGFTTAGGKVSAYAAEAILTAPFIITTNSGFGFTNGHRLFGFDVSGGAGQTQVVLGSTNLTIWVPLQTNVLTNSLWYFSDPSASNYSRRFYRAQSQ